MEPEWNNHPLLDDAVVLGLRKIDMDDYINKLVKEIDFLKQSNISLKLEVKIQRKEIAALKEERRILFNNDNVPGKCIDWWPSISIPPEKNND